MPESLNIGTGDQLPALLGERLKIFEYFLISFCDWKIVKSVV